MDEFDWGELPREWWMRTAAQVGATERHAMFAAAKHRGATNTDAARKAGFGTTPGAMRAEGYRLARSNKINQLLAIAVAEAGGGNDGTLTVGESMQILTSLARGSDPQLRIKAIESLAKIQATERDQRRDEEEPSPEESARRVLSILPARVPNLWAEFILPQHRWHTPFLRDMVPYLAAHHPEQWDGCRNFLIGEYGQLRDEVAKLEMGPVLPLEDLLQKCDIVIDAEKPRGNGQRAHERGGVEEEADAAA